MNFISGRQRDVHRIRQANRAAAVGRLFLGEIRNWQEFVDADTIDLEGLPRRQLKSGSADVRLRLSREIKAFCYRNFEGMTQACLSKIYEEVKTYRGLELPLEAFEDRFARIRSEVLGGSPAHSTVCISLWGLQLRCPEHELAKDVLTALSLCLETQAELRKFEGKSQPELQDSRDAIRSLLRKKGFAERSAVIACFNLMEAYLNGLAWDFIRVRGTDGLSNRRRSLLNDSASVSIRDKLLKYPEAVTGRELWQLPDSELDGFLDTMKPFRDSLVHPSPFSAPSKFGGHDKLRLFYRVDHNTAIMTVQLSINLIRRINEHVCQGHRALPDWIEELASKLKDCGQTKM